MSTTAPAAAEPSPIDAAVEAFEHTRVQLFPFRFDRWLTLGLVTLLDQCGRGGVTGSVPGGGGQGPVLPSGDGGGEGGGFPDVGAWLGENIVLVVGIAALVIAAVIAISALVLWINSRATFVYIDNVATGRAEIGRPWKAHAELAGSYFGWRFVLMLALVACGVALLALGAAAVVFLRERTAAMVMALIVLIPVFILLLVGASLLSLALRDFAAPIQVARKISCGAALLIVRDLVRAQPLVFFLYVVLKVCYGIAQGVVLFAGACLTCCCILIPLVTQTLLQPLFYFERAWPLFLLRRMGYDLVTPKTPIEREVST
jgi:hypothetical protein